MNDLEDEVCVLSEEFDTCKSWFASLFSAHYSKLATAKEDRKSGTFECVRPSGTLKVDNDECRFLCPPRAWEVDNLHLMITGTRDMRMDRATEGRRPVTTPMITLGILVNQ